MSSSSEAPENTKTDLRVRKRPITVLWRKLEFGELLATKINESVGLSPVKLKVNKDK